jgi:hypothetical protein
VPVVPKKCCAWRRKFESASARISRTLSTWPNHWSDGMYQTSAYPHLCKFSDGETTVLHDQSPQLVNELVISAC